MSERFGARCESGAAGRTAADRGVSEVISFALVFSLIAATVALVYVSGIGGLENTRSSEQVNNAERAFDVLADNIGDIHRQAAPSRATEIKVSDAQMEFGDRVRVNITIRNKMGGNVSVIEYQPIVYSADGGTDLVYANGALFREDRSGTVMDKNPPFLLTLDEGPDDTAGTADDEKTLILPVIETRNVGPESTGSQRTVLVRTLLAIREVTIAEDDPGDVDTSVFANPRDDNPDGTTGTEYNVTVRIQSSPDRNEIWHDYIEEQVAEAGGNFDARAGSSSACDIIDVGGTETVECSLAAENVYSTATRIDVIYR
ncbi:DUF7289 family protein [Haloglomus halophilum]|uniref:DUF7289 family protein n=1 Tax=Haloglomus halophilum TaxID=2962672 RepID=UPI0020C9B3A0|nr:hypothetical protein [Haloglomus halophilum]